MRYLKLLIVFSLVAWKTEMVAQVNKPLEIDRDSISAIVYSQVTQLEGLLNTLIENKGDLELCQSFVSQNLDSTEGIFYPGRTLIQDDISDKSSSGIARNLSVREYFENYIVDLENGGILSIRFSGLKVGIPTKGAEFDYINVVGIRDMKIKGSTLSLERKITFIIDKNRKLNPVYVANILNYESKTDASFVDYVDLKEASRRHIRKLMGNKIDQMSEEEINNEFRKREKDRLMAQIEADKYKREQHQIENEINRFLLESDDHVEKEQWESAESKLKEALALDPGSALVKARYASLQNKKPTFTKLKLIGDRFFDDRNLEEARNNYKKALQYKKQDDDIAEVEKRINDINVILTNIEVVGLKINQGRTEDARKDLEKYIASNKNIPEYYILLGDCHKNKGKWTEAITNYQAALKLNSKPAYLSLARLYTESAKGSKNPEDSYFKSLEYYTLYLKQINSAQARDELASTYFNLYSINKNVVNLNHAISQTREAIALNPGNGMYYFNLGQLFSHAVLYDSAYSAYSKAISLQNNKEVVLSYFNRGLTLMKLKDFSKAGDDFKTARMLVLPPEEARQLSAIADSLRSVAKSFYDKSMFSDAEAGYSKVIFISNEPTDAFFYRGYSRYNLSKFAEARDDFATSAKVLTYQPESDIMMAKCEYDQKNYEGALAVMKKFLDKPLNNVHKQKEIYNYAGKAKYRLNSFSDAQKYFELSLDIDKSQHEIYYFSGLCSYRLKEYKLAVEKLSSAIKTFSNEPDYYFFRGCSYYYLKEWKNTISDLNRFNTMNKNLVSGTEFGLSGKFIANASMESGMHKEAIEAYTKYLASNGTDAEAYYKRAGEYTIAKALNAAIGDYQNAIKYDSSNVYTYDAWLKLGEINLEMNYIQGALTDFEKAKIAFKGSGCDASHWGISRAYFSQKELTKATQALEEYVRLCKPELKDISKNKFIQPYRKEAAIKAILKN